MAAESGCPCVFWQGALGGMVSPDARPGEEGEAALVRLGTALAAAAGTLIPDLRPEAGGLVLARREIALPQANPGFAAVTAAGIIQRPVLDGTGEPPTVASSAGLLRLGPYLFHLAPGEVLPAVARAWDQESRSALPGLEPRVLGLCDDEVGYILQEEDFTPGRYEESVSLGPRTAALLGTVYAELRASVAGR